MNAKDNREHAWWLTGDPIVIADRSTRVRDIASYFGNLNGLPWLRVRLWNSAPTNQNDYHLVRDGWRVHPLVTEDNGRTIRSVAVVAYECQLRYSVGVVVYVQ